MDLFVTIVMLASLAGETTPSAIPTLGPVNPTAREVYISCNLFERGLNLSDPSSELSKETCAAAQVNAVVLQQQRDPRIHYCLPDELMQKAPAAPLSDEYIKYYERHAVQIADKPGFQAFFDALDERFPCGPNH